MFDDLCELEVTKAMHQINQSKFSPTFNNFFVRVLDVHRYATRSTNQLKYYTPKYRLVKYEKFLKYVDVKVWNNLDLDLKQ